MSRAGALWRSVRHTRPRQLARRVLLVAKRHALERAAPWLGMRAPLAGRSSLRPAADLPEALFPPRTEALRHHEGRSYVRFLEQERELASGMDWRPRDLLFSSQLWTMHLHAMEYLEALDDASFARVVGEWIERNPPYARRYWMDVWNSYTVSIRSVVFMQQYAARQARLSGPLRERLLSSLVRQIRFLASNLERDLGGNHLLKNLKALLWAARFFEGSEARRWGALGMRLLEHEVAEQILPDGMHYERSPSYHAQVFADLVETFSVLPDGPERSRLGARLPAMAQALVDTTHPDGRVALFNDGGQSAAYAPGSCLDAYRRVVGAPPAPRASFALSSAGYFGARADGDYVLADCGPIGPDFLPGHGHGDMLSFEWSVGGVRIVVDPGVFEYVAGPMRAYARSTRAHNTVSLDELDQCEFYGAFRVGRRARATVHEHTQGGNGFVLDGSHDGYRRLPGAPIHRRRLAVEPGTLEIADRIEGGAGQPVRARFLLHPECRVSLEQGAVRVERERVQVLLRSEGRIELERAWFCPDFGVRLDAPRILLHQDAAPSSWRSVLSGLKR